LCRWGRPQRRDYGPSLGQTGCARGERREIQSPCPEGMAIGVRVRPHSDRRPSDALQRSRRLPPLLICWPLPPPSPNRGRQLPPTALPSLPPAPTLRVRPPFRRWVETLPPTPAPRPLWHTNLGAGLVGRGLGLSFASSTWRGLLFSLRLFQPFTETPLVGSMCVQGPGQMLQWCGICQQGLLLLVASKDSVRQIFWTRGP
ncbi:hypothetical protein U9M48_043450, partial [Paspalum notatum var. saurae]